MAEPSVCSVATIAFYSAVYTGERNYSYKKSGNAILEIEVLGDRHSFECVGEMLFKHHLGEILDEELYMHMWRFEICGDKNGQALIPNIPILSKEMGTRNPFSMHPNPPTHPCRVQEGTDLMFHYDVGSPTILAASIISVVPLPTGASVDVYPRKKIDPREHLVGMKRKHVEDLPVLTIRMDDAYPRLARRLLQPGVQLDIGRGSSSYERSDQICWARIWGGGINSAWDRSLECYNPFEDMNEAFWCFEKSIAYQDKPKERADDKDFGDMLVEYKDRKTGQLYKKYVQTGGSFSVIAQVHPHSTPVSKYGLEEMVPELSAFSPPPCRISSLPAQKEQKEQKEEKSDGEPDLVVRSWSRWCFNFGLQAEWRQDPAVPHFSFAAQFPKCTAWLTKTSGQYTWMTMQRGVLSAVKNRKQLHKADNVVHKTLKHDSLHAMFADLEQQLK